MDNLFERMPKLGFGMMRLPMKGEEIDFERVCGMVDTYMKNGFNYFDTAYKYHDGKSETLIKEAVTKRYKRDEFMLATKLPGWYVKSFEDRDKIFNEQLEKTGVDYFDLYLLHCVEDGDSYETFTKYDCFNWGKEKKEQGKIKHFGFSFHGTPKLLAQILDNHPEVEFVQIQLNYVDWENPSVESGKLYEILRAHNLPILVMEPVKGGTLAQFDYELEDMLKAAAPSRSIASWAFRFAGSLDGITTILSGMSTEEQLEDNINIFKNFEPLSAKEKETLDEMLKKLFAIPQVACTSCKYCCEGCPSKINIPEIFKAVNLARRYREDLGRAKDQYARATKDGGKASDCLQCGQCEGICPQHLPIIEYLKEAAEKFD